MKKIWVDEAWEEYLFWLKEDKKILKRINDLIKDIDRNRNKGIGKPEALRFE
ncbi:type II toxin-antitoxin system YoeB family toxin, partial [Peptoniphilus asaccharolyticus]